MNQEPEAAPTTGMARCARAVGLLALAVVSAAVIWRLRPAVPTAAATPVTDIVRGCALVAWALMGYLAIAVAATCVAHLAATISPSGHGLASLNRFAPRRLRRLIDLAITAGVTAAVIGSAAGTAATAATPTHVISAPASRPVPAGAPLDWPGLPTTAPTPPAAPATLPVATPSPAHAASPGVRRHHRAEVGLVSGGHASRPAGADAEVVVQAGDSLWSIADRHLGPSASPAEVTAAWHAWYAANRSVIGSNPAQIYPGQRLAPPTAHSMPAHHQRSPR